MTDKACAVCVKRHETGNPAAPLQCRALPPVQGLARDAIFPTVAADAYCHDGFEADPVAAKAHKAAAEEAAKLDALVDDTQARASASAAQPELALGGEAEAAPPNRARRARGSAKAKA